MAEDGLCNALGLLNGCMELFREQIKREDTAIIFKGHSCSGDVLIGGADIMEEASQKVCFVGEVPFGELLGVDGLA